MMGQARSSKFVEKFEDDASVSSSSSVSLSPRTSSPKPTSQDSFSPELIIGLFSALSLEETVSRCTELRCKDLRCKKPYAQDGQPAEMEVEKSSENLLARLKDHQERLSGDNFEQDVSQPETNTTIERLWIETPNTVLNNMLEEQDGEVDSGLFEELAIPLEVVYRDNKLNIETKFGRLVQDLEIFNGQRHAIFRKFQVCFAYHEQINESASICLECSQHLRNIDKNYCEARSRVASMDRDIATFILSSKLYLEVMRKHMPDYADGFANNYEHEHTLVLSRLQLLQRMTNTLEEDAKKAKSWQDSWNVTSMPDQLEGYKQQKEKSKDCEEAKEQPEQSEAEKEPVSNSLMAQDYQDARIENAESYRAQEKSRKGKPKQSKKTRKH